jgi:hypothetical protein
MQGRGAGHKRPPGTGRRGAMARVARSGEYPRPSLVSRRLTSGQSPAKPIQKRDSFERKLELDRLSMSAYTACMNEQAGLATHAGTLLTPIPARPPAEVVRNLATEAQEASTKGVHRCRGVPGSLPGGLSDCRFRGRELDRVGMDACFRIANLTFTRAPQLRPNRAQLRETR